MPKREPAWLRGLGILFATMPFLCGCGDKALMTQPPTPTPTPTQRTSTISLDVTLSRSDPPAGVKHAARAAVVVRETGGRAVNLTRLTASSYYGIIEVRVLDFTPVQLGAGQTASFTVTLTNQEDIPCSYGVDFTIFTVEQAPAYRTVGCENVDWPF